MIIGERRHGFSGFTGSDDDDCFVPPLALYIHVPVCASKCLYCDFYSLPCESLPEGYESKLVNSTLARASALAERFKADGFATVYVGGGTPTMLSEASLDRLLAGIEALSRDAMGRVPDEWTVEANPDSLDSKKLDIMASHGVTRLSIGVQSLDRAELELLGRRHGADEAINAVRAAADRGMKVSADLIAGIPDRMLTPKRTREPGRLARAARELIGAGASHLSVYDLSLEDGTPLAENRSGLLFPGEDEAWNERKNLENSLGESGMRRYEVSNFSAPGNECRHNLTYWRMDSYVGAGPGAVSTIISGNGASLRVEETKSLESYGAEGKYSASEERIEPRDAAFEAIMMAFRTSFGLDLDSFQARFGMSAETLIRSTLESWAPWIVPGESWPSYRGYQERKGRASISKSLALNGAGLDILNKFLGDCLGEMDRSSFLKPRYACKEQCKGQ